MENDQPTTDRDPHTHRPPTPLRARARSLTASQKRLARWLETNLDTKMANEMVRRYGARDVLDVLHRRIVEYFEPFEPLVERSKRAYPKGVNVHEYLEMDGLLPGWRVDPELHNPGGALRWHLENSDA